MKTVQYSDEMQQRVNKLMSEIVLLGGCGHIDEIGCEIQERLNIDDKAWASYDGKTDKESIIESKKIDLRNIINELSSSLLFGTFPHIGI